MTFKLTLILLFFSPALAARRKAVVSDESRVNVHSNSISNDSSNDSWPWSADCWSAGGVDGITCKKVSVHGMDFDCRFAGEHTREQGDVMLLHGFPEWSKMYEPLMRALAKKGYRSVACDQRGYSQGASPDSEADYNYNNLRDDIFDVADAVGFDKFHLVAHDHGAVLGWYAAGSDRGSQRFLSYSALSIPHNDAFSAGLLGPNADHEQQMGSQYFSIFIMPNSASMRAYALTLSMGYPFGFKSASAFQKALWWYNGAMEVGVLSMPPSFTASYLWEHGSKASAALRMLFGGEPQDGVPQKVASGEAKMPTLYVCGTSDPAIFCDKPYALATKDYCPNDYQHLAVNCGHDVLSTSITGCGADDTLKVIDTIVNRITSAAALSKSAEEPASEPCRCEGNKIGERSTDGLCLLSGMECTEERSPRRTASQPPRE